MFEIMNEMCELIYVADIKNYDLLFMNAAGKKMFNVSDDDLGKKCYKVLQGRESPCPFCTNSVLKEDESYTWEFTNELVGRHYLLKDKLVDWNGTKARIEIAFDTTNSEKEKEVLKKTIESERVMMECIRQLQLNNDLDVAISNVLEKIGTFLGAERTYVFHLDNNKMYNKYEWCAQGIEPQIEHLQELDEGLIETWKPYFAKGECYIIENLEDIKFNRPKEYEILLAQNIHSLIAAPLEQDGKLIGYIGVDNPPKEKYNNVSILFHTLRYFLMSSMRRVEDEKRLTQLSYNDQLTGAFNRNRYTKDTKELILQEIPVGIVYLDINGLKDMNDKMGHAYGDYVISNFAKKVSEIFLTDQFYRVGGDEFIIICKNCSKDYFNKLILKLKKSLIVDMVCNVAIGYRWSKTSKNIEQQVSLADAMMYEDKKNYYRNAPVSNRYRYYNDDILALSDEKVLQRELSAGNFHVCFRPKYLFLDNSLVGAEALIRYYPSNGNVILHDQFLPLLEELHLINKVDIYFFHCVCAKIVEWKEKGEKMVPICVGFSRSSMSDKSFLDKLTEICRQYGVDKKYLVIEITDNSEILEEFDFSRVRIHGSKGNHSASNPNFACASQNISIG